ncbi:hypothetical protein C8R42DRAFT_644682 [Lentinula raphanica]|nr:hypothetical protein C8R42DRAFT_644682 [Lentinula raphanica]
MKKRKDAHHFKKLELSTPSLRIDFHHPHYSSPPTTSSTLKPDHANATLQTFLHTTPLVVQPNEYYVQTPSFVFTSNTTVLIPVFRTQTKTKTAALGAIGG